MANTGVANKDFICKLVKVPVAFNSPEDVDKSIELALPTIETVPFDDERETCPKPLGETGNVPDVPVPPVNSKTPPLDDDPLLSDPD